MQSSADFMFSLLIDFLRVVGMPVEYVENI